MKILSVLTLLLLMSCAHPPIGKGADPKFLLQQACSPGAHLQGVTGSVWLKAKSKEASGQFPALVSANSPGQLNLEVTNLLGGSEATISVSGNQFRIRARNGQNRSGQNSWGGIPLFWASDLFIGKVPCPSAQALVDAALSVDPDGQLLIQIKSTLGREAETYGYKFRSFEGQPWPESLHWERKGAFYNSVDFSFDDPEEHSLSPQKWEAKSPQGEVRVRWKDRKTTPTSG